MPLLQVPQRMSDRFVITKGAVFPVSGETYISRPEALKVRSSSTCQYSLPWHPVRSIFMLLQIICRSVISTARVFVTLLTICFVFCCVVVISSINSLPEYVPKTNSSRLNEFLH